MTPPKEANQTREEFLQSVNEVVSHDREATHGRPERSFQDIAKFWSAFLNIEIQPWEVTVMMSLLKVARLKTAPHSRDNWLDMAGYAACGQEIRPPKYGENMQEATLAEIRGVYQAPDKFSDHIQTTGLWNAAKDFDRSAGHSMEDRITENMREMAEEQDEACIERVIEEAHRKTKMGSVAAQQMKTGF